MNGLALTDQQGFELTDSRDGTVVDADCAGADASGVPCCTGACARVRRYDRCPASAQSACYTPGPEHIWVCTDFRCTLVQWPDGSTRQATDEDAPPRVIVWQATGYARTDVEIDTIDVPEGDVIWSVDTAGLASPSGGVLLTHCFTDCADPALIPRQCPLFEEATPCPGQRLPDGLPRVFVPVVLEGGVVIFRPGDCAIAAPVSGPGASGSGICYEFRVGRAPWRGPLPDGAVLGEAGALGSQCCQCVRGCVRTDIEVPDCLKVGVVRRLRCCCSCEGVFRAQYQWEMVTREYALDGTLAITTTETGRGTAEMVKGPECQVVGAGGQASYVYDALGPAVFDGHQHIETSEEWLGAGEVCVDTQMAPNAAPLPMYRPWGVINPDTGLEEFREANFKCPSELGGRREYTWQSDDGRNVVKMALIGVGRIVRCGFMATSWGCSVEEYQDGRLVLSRTFRGSLSRQRDGEVRCTSALGCGGQSGIGSTAPGNGLLAGGCGGCGSDEETGGATI